MRMTEYFMCKTVVDAGMCVIMYHFTLRVLCWNDDEYTIPSFLKLELTKHRGYSKVKLFKSIKYDTMSKMMEDFNAIRIPYATANFYNNNERLPFFKECETTV